MTNAWPDKAMFQALESKVSALKQSDTSVARLQDSGADSLYVLGGQATPKEVNKLRISFTPSTAKPRLVTEVRIQVPAGSVIPNSVTVQTGSPLIEAHVFNCEVIEVAGVTWLSLKVLAMLGQFETVLVTFGAPYTILYLDPSLVPSDPGTNFVTWVTDSSGNEPSGPLIGAHLVTEGKRTVVGKFSPDAFPTTTDQTPISELVEGGIELALPAQEDAANGSLPYLRLKLYGKEYRLQFQLEQAPVFTG